MKKIKNYLLIGTGYVGIADEEKPKTPLTKDEWNELLTTKDMNFRNNHPHIKRSRSQLKRWIETNKLKNGKTVSEHDETNLNSSLIGHIADVKLIEPGIKLKCAVKVNPDKILNARSVDGMSLAFDVNSPVNSDDDTFRHLSITSSPFDPRCKYGVVSSENSWDEYIHQIDGLFGLDENDNIISKVEGINPVTSINSNNVQSTSDEQNNGIFKERYFKNKISNQNYIEELNSDDPKYIDSTNTEFIMSTQVQQPQQTSTLPSVSQANTSSPVVAPPVPVPVPCSTNNNIPNKTQYENPNDKRNELAKLITEQVTETNSKQPIVLDNKTIQQIAPTLSGEQLNKIEKQKKEDSNNMQIDSGNQDPIDKLDINALKNLAKTQLERHRKYVKDNLPVIQQTFKSLHSDLVGDEAKGAFADWLNDYCKWNNEGWKAKNSSERALIGQFKQMENNIQESIKRKSTISDDIGEYSSKLQRQEQQQPIPQQQQSIAPASAPAPAPSLPPPPQQPINTPFPSNKFTYLEKDFLKEALDSFNMQNNNSNTNNFNMQSKFSQIPQNFQYPVSVEQSGDEKFSDQYIETFLKSQKWYDEEYGEPCTNIHPVLYSRSIKPDLSVEELRDKDQEFQRIKELPTAKEEENSMIYKPF